MTLNRTANTSDVALLLEKANWEKLFSSTSYEFGCDLVRDNRVGNIALTQLESCYVITSRVTESPSRFFDVKIYLMRSGKFNMRCDCTCPVGGQCKHSVAVLNTVESSTGVDLEVTKDDKPGKSVIRQQEPAKPIGLSLEAKSWIKQIKAKISLPVKETDELPDHYTQTDVGESGIVYVLLPATANHSKRGCYYQIEVRLIRRVTKRKFGESTRVKLQSMSRGYFPNFVPGHERDRIRQMLDLCPKEDFAQSPFLFTPENRIWHEIIEEMLEDEVLIADGESPKPLEKGPGIIVEPFWVMGKGGAIETGLRDLETKEVVTVIATEPAIYINRETSTYGPADMAFPAGLSAVSWLSAPMIQPEEFQLLTKELNLPASTYDREIVSGTEIEEKSSTGLPALPDVAVTEIDGTKIEPKGSLVLKRINVVEPHVAQNPWGGVTEYIQSNQLTEFPVALLKMEYGDYTIENPLTDPLDITITEGEELVRIHRHVKSEAKLVESLYELGLENLADQELPWMVRNDETQNALSFPIFSIDEPVREWSDFLLNHAEELREQGWEIEIDDTFYFKVARSADWYADLDEKPENGIEWMEFDYGIEHNGKRISLISVLASALRFQGAEFDPATMLEAPEDEKTAIYIEEEQLLVPVPVCQLGRIYQALTELLNQPEKMTLHPLEAAQVLNDLGEGSFDDSETIKNLRELGKKIANFKGIKKARVPKALNAELRHYQEEGLSWLQFLRDNQLNGILADDMGLGKTIQTLASIQIEKSSRRLKNPALIIAPTSVVSNWVSEAERFTPGLKVLCLHGPNRSQHFGKIQKYDIVVTSYALLNRDIDQHLDEHYHYVILDEAQLIKNPKSRMAKNACSLKSNHRLCLTGTPMENHLGELWSLVHFLMPGFLGQYDIFRKIWQRPIENHDDGNRRDLLTRKISPILLRRTKDLVLKELPARTDIVQEIVLDKAQSDLYESVRAAMDKKVRDALKDKGLNRSHIIVLDALLKLRQICCHPNLLKTKSAQKVKQSAKLEVFEELVKSQVEAGRRILVFSQFTSMIAIIEKSLEKLRIDNVKLTGSTTNRKEVIDQFQNGDVPVFLISLKAGGSGLNLTAADCVIHYDPWWNPAVEEQATARAHRMGQENPVFVYRLVTKGSIEERILELQKKKAELAASILSAGESGSAGRKEGRSAKSLTQSDLEMLFAPIDQ